MRGLRVMVDWLCYARPSLAARSFGTLRHRGREAYSSHEGQSRCVAPCSFHCQPPFEMSGRARASTAPAPKLSLTMTPSRAVVGNWCHQYLASPGRRVSRFTYRRKFMLPRRRTHQIGPTGYDAVLRKAWVGTDLGHLMPSQMNRRQGVSRLTPSSRIGKLLVAPLPIVVGNAGPMRVAGHSLPVHTARGGVNNERKSEARTQAAGAV
jgi:hypothetical protein